MAGRVVAPPRKPSFKKPGLKGSSKSGRGESRPVPLITTAAPPLVIAASRPRNPIAIDALLRKSGAHNDKRRSQKLRAHEQLQSGLDEARKQGADDSTSAQ
jgi:hypothetical protein